MSPLVRGYIVYILCSSVVWLHVTDIYIYMYNVDLAVI